MIKKLPLLFFLLLAMATSGFSQRTTRITAQFSSASFEQVVNKIEEQTDFRLSYNSTWTDSLTVDLNVSNEEVASVLDKILSGTEFHYHIYQNNIYITRDRQILTELPIDFCGQDETKTK